MPEEDAHVDTSRVQSLNSNLRDIMSSVAGMHLEFTSDLIVSAQCACDIYASEPFSS